MVMAFQCRARPVERLPAVNHRIGKLILSWNVHGDGGRAAGTLFSLGEGKTGRTNISTKYVTLLHFSTMDVASKPASQELP